MTQKHLKRSFFTHTYKFANEVATLHTHLHKNTSNSRSLHTCVSLQTELPHYTFTQKHLKWFFTHMCKLGQLRVATLHITQKHLKWSFFTHMGKLGQLRVATWQNTLQHLWWHFSQCAQLVDQQETPETHTPLNRSMCRCVSLSVYLLVCQSPLKWSFSIHMTHQQID